MKHLPLYACLFLLITPAASLWITPAFAETENTASDKKKVSIPIQVDLIKRLEKAGLQPSVTQKVVPPEYFKMPEVPQTITNENLSPAGQVQMDQLGRKRAEGKQTETEHNLEKDTLFRDANLKY